MTDECPDCQADLRGPPIPVESLRRGYYGEWDGVTPRYFSRRIAIYDRDRDRAVEWLCPDCGARRNRFTGERIA